MTQLDSVLTDWQVPELPESLRVVIPKSDLEMAALLCRQKVAADIKDRKNWQITISDWLYQLVRSNVRRGRAFEPEEVLVTGRADCLGYTRLFAAIAPRFGLELGIVEVLVDNMGRYVPHHVNLLNLTDGTRRFMDAWYGSADIHHRRIGALVNGETRDIDRKGISSTDDLRGLSDQCIEAITLYIRGNRCLEREEPDRAIEYYSTAIKLYPNNSRAYYNRAVAYERKGEANKARQDYAQALKDERSLIRVLATTNELEELIRLDELGITEEEQDIYLWHKGFKTGTTAGYKEIGQKYGISPEAVKEIISGVESLCAS